MNEPYDTVSTIKASLVTLQQGARKNQLHVFCIYQQNSLYKDRYYAPAHWGLGERDGLLVSPGKASNRPTDHLITG